LRVAGTAQDRRWIGADILRRGSARHAPASSSSAPVITSGSSTAARRSAWNSDSAHHACRSVAGPIWWRCDEALTRLEQSDPRKAQIVSLRYFAG
jgi:hypothetical protein